MSFENPLKKVGEAKSESDARKLEAARKPGTLRPQGQGGRFFRRVKEAMETIGTKDDKIEREEPERVEKVRALFERKILREGKRIYDEYLVVRKGSPSLEKYEKDVKKSFEHGFDLYLKTQIQLDKDQAPKPHKGDEVNDGGRKINIPDELSTDDYFENYIAKGSGIDLEKNDKDHDFDREEAGEGFADKYQSTVEVGGEVIKSKEDAEVQSGVEAYMFEKLRIYTAEYFEMLKESLERGVKYKDALDMSTYIYGNDAGIYKEMESAGLDAQFVANQSVLNRARVRVPFEKFVEAGERLDENYPYEPGSGTWVTSPQMIRNLIFKYPQTVESGLAVAEIEMDRLQETYPQMPRYLLVEACVSSPDVYEKQIRDFLEQGHQVMERYPARDYAEDVDGDNNIFAHFNVEGDLLRLLDRVDSKKSNEAVDRSLAAFKETVARAEEKGVDTSHGAKRRMLKSLLGYNISPEKVLGREERITNRRLREFDDLVEKAEEIDPLYGGYHVDLGYGDSQKEILETGKIMTDLIIEQYGQVDGERHLDRLTDVMYAYLFHDGFPVEPAYVHALKDSLVMNPYNPREAFEDLYSKDDLVWPEGVEIIPFSK